MAMALAMALAMAMAMAMALALVLAMAMAMPMALAMALAIAMSLAMAMALAVGMAMGGMVMAAFEGKAPREIPLQEQIVRARLAEKEAALVLLAGENARLEQGLAALRDAAQSVVKNATKGRYADDWHDTVKKHLVDKLKAALDKMGDGDE